jgi:hypothetical protein
VSSADGWLVEGESPKQAPGLCREKRRPKTGEGRAYTQNPATAQARALGLSVESSSPVSAPVPVPVPARSRAMPGRGSSAPRAALLARVRPLLLILGLPRSSPRAQVHGGVGSR